MNKTNPKFKGQRVVCHWCRKPFSRKNPLVQAILSFGKNHKYNGHKKCHNIMGEIMGRYGHIIFKNTKVIEEISER